MFFYNSLLKQKDVMDIEFSKELIIAKRAALEAGDFLRKNKNDLNKTIF